MRYLGIDYGRRRIGLALSDATGQLARPWKTIAREGNSQQVATAIGREIAALRQDGDGLAAVVLGWPRRLSGEGHELTRAVEMLAEQLRRDSDLPVILQDERLTTRQAEEWLSARQPDWRKRKTLLDSMAAAVILQDYLDSLPRSRAAEDRDW